MSATPLSHTPDPDLYSPLDAPPPQAARTLPAAEELWDDAESEAELSEPSLALDSGLWLQLPPRPPTPWTTEARTEASAAASTAALRAAARAPTRPDASVVSRFQSLIRWLGFADARRR